MANELDSVKGDYEDKLMILRQESCNTDEMEQAKNQADGEIQKL